MTAFLEITGTSDANIEGAKLDIARFATRCKFADCSHRDEPDCGVAGARTEGDLDPDRLASYLDLCHKLSELDEEIEEYERTRRRRRDARRG